MAWWFASQYAVPPGVPLATVHISPNLVESAGSSQQYALAVIVAVTELPAASWVAQVGVTRTKH